MKRLTKRNIHGVPYYPECFDKCAGKGPSIKCHCCYFEHEIIIKLAEYEDLEEQGRLIVLPCKTGDTIYITGSRYRRGRIESWINTGKFRISDMEELGKHIFLTKAEAEKALEMEK